MKWEWIEELIAYNRLVGRDSGPSVELQEALVREYHRQQGLDRKVADELVAHEIASLHGRCDKHARRLQALEDDAVRVSEVEERLKTLEERQEGFEAWCRKIDGLSNKVKALERKVAFQVARHEVVTIYQRLEALEKWKDVSGTAGRWAAPETLPTR